MYNRLSKLKQIALMVCLLAMPALTMALGPGGPSDPGCDPLDPACPIDGGLSLLIAAGVGLGAKKAYDSRKKNK